MNLHAKLRQREAAGRPVRVGLIGAGKFGAMYLAQLPKTPGVHLVGIADLSPANARVSLARVGWPVERYAAPTLDAAFASGTTHVGDDWQALVAHPQKEGKNGVSSLVYRPLIVHLHLRLDPRDPGRGNAGQRGHFIKRQVGLPAQSVYGSLEGFWMPLSSKVT